MLRYVKEQLYLCFLSQERKIGREKHKIQNNNKGQCEEND